MEKYFRSLKKYKYSSTYYRHVKKIENETRKEVEVCQTSSKSDIIII